MVLVTGATGLLGRVVVLELLKRGKIVRAAKRPSSNLEDVLHSYHFYTEDAENWFKKIEWQDVDFQDIESLKNALENVDEVYHCAATVNFDPKNRKKLYQTNIGNTQNLLYACESSSVKKFCFVSSISVFDGLNSDGKVDETCDFNPKLNHSDYAISKHFAEMEAWRASAEGLDMVILNPGIIIGSGNWNQSSGQIFGTAEKQAFAFSGGSSYVDVRDVAKISVELMDKNIFGEKFILVSESWKYLKFNNLIREKLNLKPARQISDTLPKAAVIANYFLGWLIPKLKMATKTNVEAVTSFNKISNEKIKQAIGYQFVPIDQSLDFHVRNYIEDRQQNRIKPTSPF